LLYRRLAGASSPNDRQLQTIPVATTTFTGPPIVRAAIDTDDTLFIQTNDGTYFYHQGRAAMRAAAETLLRGPLAEEHRRASPKETRLSDMYRILKGIDPSIGYTELTAHSSTSLANHSQRTEVRP
jgi:hypothetical protein